MRDGGTLKVAIERLGDDWQVSFADTGTGMTPQQTEKIFEPFQSNFEGGTGLGLAVVYQIVQAHEGKVWARSKPGQGTTFVLRLRRLDAERPATTASFSGKLRRAASCQPPRPRNSRLPRQKGGRVANILVCDDERSICEMLDIALRRDGHRVETVNSARPPRTKSTALFTTSSSPTSRCRTSTASKCCAMPIAFRPTPPSSSSPP